MKISAREWISISIATTAKRRQSKISCAVSRKFRRAIWISSGSGTVRLAPPRLPRKDATTPRLQLTACLSRKISGLRRVNRRSCPCISLLRSALWERKVQNLSPSPCRAKTRAAPTSASWSLRRRHRSFSSRASKRNRFFRWAVDFRHRYTFATAMGGANLSI